MARDLRRCALTAFAVVLATATSASAATTFTVDKNADDAGAGLCTGAANDCSLRSAIFRANAGAGGDTITIPAGAYAVATPQEQITKPVTVAGAATRSTIIDGGGAADKLLDVSVTGPVAISDLTIRGAFAPAVLGTAVNIDGGQSVVLSRLAIVDNNAAGLNVQSGSVELRSSLIARNTAPAVAGVIAAGSNAILSVKDSTIAQNTALAASPDQNIAYTGGLVTAGATLLTNSTIAGNRVAANVDAIGGDNLFQIAVSTSLSLLRLSNTIVADPGSHGNCGGDIQSSGHNLDSDGTCGLGAVSDLTGADPLLQALADNGGPTDTRALAEGSAAVDMGSGCGATDQRGSGFARPLGGACDIGAFESPFTKPPPAPAVLAANTTATPAAATTASPPDTTPAKVTLGGLGATVKRSTANKGLKVTITSDEAVSVEATLLVSPRRVTIAKAFDLSVGTATLKRGTGKRTLTIKPKKKIAGKRKVSALLRILAIDAGGNKTIVTKAFTIK